MKTIKTIVLSVLLVNLVSITAFAQNQNLDFHDKEMHIKGDDCSTQRSVFFSIIKINDEDDQNKVVEALLNNDKIIDVFIKDLGTCYLKFDKSMSVQEIRDILISNGFDFDFKTIKVFNPKFIHPNIPDDFPVYIETGDNKLDISNYVEKFNRWISNNSETWNNCINE